MTADHAAGGLILVAEDEHLVREVAVRTLRHAGYDTLAAGDGEEAVCLFEEHREQIALVLLDVVMPRRSGREAYQRIREMRPDVPVLFSTGYDPNADHARFIVQENLRLLEKPFDPCDLLDAVREALEGAGS